MKYVLCLLPPIYVDIDICNVQCKAIICCYTYTAHSYKIEIVCVQSLYDVYEINTTNICIGKVYGYKTPDGVTIINLVMAFNRLVNVWAQYSLKQLMTCGFNWIVSIAGKTKTNIVNIWLKSSLSGKYFFL